MLELGSLWGLAIGLGCLWHGLQIIWVAPPPRLLKRFGATQEATTPPQQSLDRAQAFQLFWLDQYAWIGYVLSAAGLVLAGFSLT